MAVFYSDSSTIHLNQTQTTLFGVYDEVSKYNVQLNIAERLWAVRFLTSTDTSRFGALNFINWTCANMPRSRIGLVSLDAE